MESKKKEHNGPLPSINKFMHQRNPYKTPPSFKKLATLYPEFRQHCTYDFCGKVHLDFKNAKALNALTTCLLDQDFGLKVSIPSDRLVPTLPLRLNYLLWIEDLLTLIYRRQQESEINYSVTGFDVGTGAACIYPLLGAKKFKWRFLGTESDEFSYKSAVKNVSSNNLEDKILIKNTDKYFEILEDADVLDFLKVKSTTTEETGNSRECGSAETYRCAKIDFTMCNPPFFSSEEETDSLKKSKKDTRSEPRNAPTGSPHEKIIEGGEVAFVSKMIELSVIYKNRIRIFTSLIGNKKNVKTIKNLIREVKPANFSVTEFCQGRTMRWGVAWTFDPSIKVEKILSKKQMCDAKPLTLMIPRTQMNQYTVQAAWQRVNSWLKELKIKPRIVKKNNYFVSSTIKAYKETWLHQRKKKRDIHRSAQHPKCDTSEVANENKRKLSEVGNNKLPNKQKRVRQENEKFSSPSDGLKSSSESDKNEDSFTEDKTEVLASEDGKLLLDNGSNGEFSSSPSTGNEGKCNNNTPYTHGGDVRKLLLTTNASLSLSGDVLTAGSAEMDRITVQANESDTTKAATNLECLLRCSVNIKQTNAVINLEMSLLGGNKGKDAMNQLMQYFKNRFKSRE